MLGSEIKTMYEGLIDDSPDEDLTYQLMNQVKNEIEENHIWQMLMKRDASNTATTKLVAKSLPSDFRSSVKLMIEDDTISYDQIPFESREQFEDQPRKWFLDFANSNFYLTGSLSELKTLYLYYQYATDDIVAATSPVWPSRFHPLIAYKMAIKYYAIDKGEKGRAWDDRWTLFAREMLDSMIRWDGQLSMNALEGLMNADFNTNVEDSIRNQI